MRAGADDWVVCHHLDGVGAGLADDVGVGLAIGQKPRHHEHEEEGGDAGAS